MTSDRPDPTNPENAMIRERALNAIARNRIPGLHFTGHFLGVEWLEATPEIVRLKLPDGPHCRDADGRVNFVALGMLADHLLATTTRTDGDQGARLGTLFLQLQFTGAPICGDITGEARLLGRSEGAAMQKMTSAGTISANRRTVCQASGEFVFLGAPPGVSLAPLPWQRGESFPPVEPVAEQDLHPEERAILKTCDRALKRASPQATFVQHFWGGIPRRTASGASNRPEIGLHIGNRVGHVQGGALLGLAGVTARAAAPAGMMLSNLSAWYISPGRGAALSIRSRVLHAGRTTAVVRTEIRTTEGERVVEAVSHHMKRARA